VDLVHSIVYFLGQSLFIFIILIIWTYTFSDNLQEQFTLYIYILYFHQINDSMIIDIESKEKQ